MTLRQKQSRFVEMIGRLIQFTYANGYELTLGDGKCSSGHMENSLHYIGLAQDLNLFQDGVFMQNTADHLPLGEYWESMGGSWGGRFNDGNHYSIEHLGRK